MVYKKYSKSSISPVGLGTLIKWNSFTIGSNYSKKSRGHHRYLVEGIADQQSQLVSILAGGRNSNLIKKQSKIKS